MKRSMRILGLLGLLSIAAPARSAGSPEGGAVGAAWLNLGAEGRSAGLAGAMSAVDGGMGSLGFNPAGLAALQHPTVSAGYLAWVDGTSMQSLGLGWPLGPGVAALAMNYFDAGAVDRVNAPVGGGSPQIQGTLDLFFLNVGLTWAQTLGPVQLGASLHLLDQALDGPAAWGLAWDLGSRWNTPLHGLSAGGALRTWGQPMQGSALPENWRAGLAYRPPALPGAMLSMDYEALVFDSHAALLDLGLELQLHPRFSIRGGLKAGSELSAQGYSAGASFVTGPLTLHYAFQHIGPLDAIHLLSLELVFSSPACPPPPKPKATPPKKTKRPKKPKPL